MKKISMNLSTVIIALAGVVLLISAISLFRAPIGDFFTNIADKKLAVGQKVLESIDYKNNYIIFKGAGQTYSSGTLSFTSTAPFSKFAGVKVNDELVDPVNYTVEEGSTIVTFTEEYSKVLANGDYTIEILATDGAAAAPFDVDINGDVDNGDVDLEVAVTYYWKPISYNGLDDVGTFRGRDVWVDGSTVYYSCGSTQLVLNGDTWETMSWTGLTSFTGNYVWTDGTNIYYSSGSEQYVLNGTTWETMSWTGLTNFNGNSVWTDGTNIYYSRYGKQYVLNGTTWEAVTWNGLTSFDGSYIWTDGTNIYYSYVKNHYVLNGDTWEEKTWNGLTSYYGNKVWTDGRNIYYSGDKSTNQWKLDTATDTWSTITWEWENTTSEPSFTGEYVWTDGTNIYYSSGPWYYVLAYRSN